MYYRTDYEQTKAEEDLVATMIVDEMEITDRLDDDDVERAIYKLLGIS